MIDENEIKVTMPKYIYEQKLDDQYVKGRSRGVKDSFDLFAEIIIDNFQNIEYHLERKLILTNWDKKSPFVTFLFKMKKSIDNGNFSKHKAASDEK